MICVRSRRGIIWNYGLTRAIVAAARGAELAVSGAVLQALLRNALADRYILSITAKSSTGAMSVMVLGIGAARLSLPASAFLVAIVAFALVVVLALAAGSGTGLFKARLIILAEVAGTLLFTALTSFAIAQLASAKQIHGVTFWMMGSKSGVRWLDVWPAMRILALGVPVCRANTRTLDVFTFGTGAAVSVGIAIRPVQVLLIGAAVMMIATWSAWLAKRVLSGW